MQNSGRSVVIVLGPPRSGTSAVCHVLQELGVNFGDPALFIDPEENLHNPIFFELVSLNEINEEIIRELGWEYRDFAATPLEDDFSALLADRFEAKIADFIHTNFGDSPEIGLKDPRFCFTLPLWMTVLNRLGLETRCLLTQRDDEAVAVSNFRLNPNRGIEYSRRIALLSNGAAANFLRERNHEIVVFEALASAALPAIEALKVVTGRSTELVTNAVSNVFDSKLMHWQGNGTSASGIDIAGDYLQLAKLMRKFQMPMKERREAASLDSDAGLGRGQPLSNSLTDEDRAILERGKVQLYFRTAVDSYSEENSIVMPWPSRASVETIAFELPEENDTSYVRIDTNDFPGAYAIHHLRIDDAPIPPINHVVAGNGAILELSEGVGLVANHDDPWLEFKLPPGELRRIEVRIERIGLADAGRKIFGNTDLEDLLGTLSERITRIDTKMAGVGTHTEVSLASGLRMLSERLRNDMAEIKDSQTQLFDSTREIQRELSRATEEARSDARQQQTRTDLIISMLKEIGSSGIRRVFGRWFKK